MDVIQQWELLIVSGYSKVQLRAISDSIIEKLEQEFDRPPIRSEAKNQSGWVLLDYGDLIVHIMTPEQREFYNLEAFWGHGDTVPLPEIVKAPTPAYDLYGNTPEEDFEDDIESEIDGFTQSEIDSFTPEELEYYQSDKLEDETRSKNQGFTPAEIAAFTPEELEYYQSEGM